MGPKRFESGGPALREFRFCNFKLRDERQPFRIGQPLVRHNELPPASSLVPSMYHNQYPYIDSYCRNDGLLEHLIETTSEVVLIPIG
jgi:hypothetical protein